MTPAIVEPKNSTVSHLNSLNITNRNVQSAYQQSDTSYLTHRPAGDIPDLADTIVLQYGSRFFKVGLSRDALPRTIPHVIAHRGTLLPEHHVNGIVSEEELQDRLNARYKCAKKKPPPNIYSSIIAHNKTAVEQRIPALNDAYGFEWTKTGNAKFITGTAALRINPEEEYVKRWPIQRGNFNRQQYKSSKEVTDDMDRIWSRVIIDDLKIPRRDFGKYGMMLVVPDGVMAFEIRALIDLMVREMGFRSVGFILESVAGTFGSGISSALVIDIGAQTSNVVCIEDGQVLPASKSILPYGGDELSRLLLSILKIHHFPYTDCDLQKSLDFEMIDDLKVRMCTMDEDDISSQVYEVYVRNPGQSTKVFPFKVYEERIIVPSALFESEIPLLAHFADTTENPSFYAGENDPIYYANGTNGDSEATETAPSEPASEIIMSDVYESDVVLVEMQPLTRLSLIDAINKAFDSLDGATNPDRLKKFLGSVLVIGNGHKFPHFVAHLGVMLRERYPGNDVEFVLGGAAGQPAKESLVMDAGVVTWKGGAVMSKLDCMNDFWISQHDYDLSGVRIIRDRLTFVPN